MTPEQMEEAQAEADNYADSPIGELLDLALKEIARLKRYEHHMRIRQTRIEELEGTIRTLNGALGICEKERDEAQDAANMNCADKHLALERIEELEAENSRLRSLTKGICVEPGCERTTRSKRPRYCMEHR